MSEDENIVASKNYMAENTVLVQNDAVDGNVTLAKNDISESTVVSENDETKNITSAETQVPTNNCTATENSVPSDVKKTSDTISGEEKPDSGNLLVDAVNEKFDSQNENTIEVSNSVRKVFVGGIPRDATSNELAEIFSQFGLVEQVEIKYDSRRNRSRNFAFVTFAEINSYTKAITQASLIFKGKHIDIKQAKSREDRKIFVGGIPIGLNKDHLLAHFQKFGEIEHIEWPINRSTNTPRSYAFIVFATQQAANQALCQQKQVIEFRECSVKKALPKNSQYQNSQSFKNLAVMPFSSTSRISENPNIWNLRDAFVPNIWNCNNYYLQSQIGSNWR
ncbi:unnamed protein product [Thelazia callipaeda]|uniref:RRM domain-containing protein n=1 Tax=Thelazia callipaeda TaxID=103827 RepID=A0A0N5CLK0_THECL|nr:unnamed protein product [Thelazia callipaeda]